MQKTATTDDWDSKAYNAGSYMQNHCANQIMSKHNFPRDAKILDLGCGDGRNTADLLQYAEGVQILGVDKSPKMLASANANYASDSVSFLEKDITQLDEQERFDYVVSFFCLDWIEDQLSLHKRICSALKPGGKTLLVISTGNDPVADIVERVARSDSWHGLLKNHDIPAGLHTPDVYRTSIEAAGFAIDALDIIQLPTELPNLEMFQQFIAALPLFGDVLTKAKNYAIVSEIAKSFQQYCDTSHDGKIICVGEMIVVKATKL